MTHMRIQWMCVSYSWATKLGNTNNSHSHSGISFFLLWNPNSHYTLPFSKLRFKKVLDNLLWMIYYYSGMGQVSLGSRPMSYQIVDELWQLPVICRKKVRKEGSRVASIVGPTKHLWVFQSDPFLVVLLKSKKCMGPHAHAHSDPRIEGQNLWFSHEWH